MKSEQYLNSGYPLERLLATSEYSIYFASSPPIDELNRIGGNNQTCLLTHYALIHANWQIERLISWIIEDAPSKLNPWSLRDKIEWLPQTNEVSIDC